MARYCTRENAPLGKWNGVPIYLTTILTVLLAAGFLFSAVLHSIRSPLLTDLTFIVPGGSLNWLSWLTYPLIDQLSFFTPFCIFLFYWFAVGIETHLGRRILVQMIALIVVVPVLLGLIAWHAFGIPIFLRSNYVLSAAMMIGFATLYPSAEALGWVPFKWVSFACLVTGSIMALADHDHGTLLGLWGASAAAFLCVRHALNAEHDDAIPIAARVRSWFRKKPKLRVVQPPVPSARATPISRAIPQEVDLEIDPLLDKIAKSGLGSLSKAERAKLERARQELLKKEHS